MPKVLLFGSTGLVGSGIAAWLARERPDWPVSSYHRDASKDAHLRSAYNIQKIYHGTYDEEDKIRTAVKEHDFLINAGDGKQAEPSKTIIAGLMEREGSGRGGKGTLVHYSGTGNFLDGHRDGKFDAQSRVWSDDSEQDLKDIRSDMLNGAADKLVLEAGEEGSIDTYIICPSVIHGTHEGFNGLSFGVGLVVDNAKSLGFSPYIGDGSARFISVHVKDVIRFTGKVIDLAASKEAASESAYSKYYIMAGKYYTWKQLAEVLAPVLYGKGSLTSAEAKSVPFEEAGQLAFLLGGNMLAKGPRAESIGFKSTEVKSLIETLKTEPF